MPALTRRDLLRLPLAAPLAPLSGAAAQRRNVLLIAVDDLNTRIACYGDPVVKTPNIDRLARRGVRFERAYCNYPLCNPTRTSLLSGRRPETTQVYNNNTPPRTHLGDVVFLPEHFKANGYFTARVGKIAHGRYEDAIRWDVSESRAGVPVRRRELRDEDPPGAEGGAAKLSWTRSTRPDEEQPDGATARRIVDLIEKQKSGPFFIGCGFHKPHLPWVAPAKYFDLYDVDRIQLPATPNDDRDDIPPLALTFTKGDDVMSDRQRREAILAYHAATSFMDAQLGLVLDALDRNRLWDNTVVLLFGDHGWHLFDHLQLWRKMTVFEEAAHAPLIVHAPGKKENVSSPRLVEFVDIYPTLTELAGASPAAGMEGKSFAPLLDNPRRPWKQAAYTMVSRGKNGFGRSVRTERYRYTEWNGGKDGIEFYDHETDIHEWINAAWPARKPDPKQLAVMAELKKLLK
jgi:uncharacterized sulfatase